MEAESIEDVYCSVCSRELDDLEPYGEAIGQIGSLLRRHDCVLKSSEQDDGRVYVAVDDPLSPEASELEQDLLNSSTIAGVEDVDGGLLVFPNLMVGECECGQSTIVEYDTLVSERNITEDLKSCVRVLSHLANDKQVGHIAETVDQLDDVDWDVSELFLNPEIGSGLDSTLMGKLELKSQMDMIKREGMVERDFNEDGMIEKEFNEDGSFNLSKGGKYTSTDELYGAGLTQDQVDALNELYANFEADEDDSENDDPNSKLYGESPIKSFRKSIDEDDGGRFSLTGKKTPVSEIDLSANSLNTGSLEGRINKLLNLQFDIEELDPKDISVIRTPDGLMLEVGMEVRELPNDPFDGMSVDQAEAFLKGLADS